MKTVFYIERSLFQSLPSSVNGLAPFVSLPRMSPFLRVFAAPPLHIQFPPSPTAAPRSSRQVPIPGVSVNSGGLVPFYGIRGPVPFQYGVSSFLISLLGVGYNGTLDQVSMFIEAFSLVTPTPLLSKSLLRIPGPFSIYNRVRASS